MFWVVHLFALILFWPALFVTVPLHIISSRMQPATPKKSNFTQLPGWFVGSVLGGFILILVWMARNPSPEPVAASQAVPVPVAPPAAPAKPPSAEALKKAIEAQAGNYAYDLAVKSTQRLIELYPESAEAKAAKGQLPKLQVQAAQQADFTVPSDPGGKFRQLHLEGPYNARTIITRRDGAAGVTYTTRIYNCNTRQYRSLGSASTIEKMRSYDGPSKWSDLVPNSIASVVRDRACAQR